MGEAVAIGAVVVGGRRGVAIKGAVKAHVVRQTGSMGRIVGVGGGGEVDKGVFNFAAMAIGAGKFGEHFLSASDLINAGDHFGGERHGGPAMSDEAGARGETHEPVASLLVTGGAEADGSHGALGHIVAVVLVGLCVGPERNQGVLRVANLESNEKTPGGHGRRCAIGGREGVKPKKQRFLRGG